jgi:hypothetical protein
MARWFAQQYPHDHGMRVPHETIWKTLFMQARGALKKELYEHLRQQRGIRRPFWVETAFWRVSAAWRKPIFSLYYMTLAMSARNLAKVEVASSSLVSRSKLKDLGDIADCSVRPLSRANLVSVVEVVKVPHRAGCFASRMVDSSARLMRRELPIREQWRKVCVGSLSAELSCDRATRRQVFLIGGRHVSS